MSVLIVQLPVPLPGNSSHASADYNYVQTKDGLTPESHGTSPAATLPSAGLAADVVVLVPFQALSWHQVELPKGALSGGQARLRAVLDGLLEDRLLDDPAALHLAVSPHAQAGQAVWVAACDKSWLKSAVAPLEAAGRPVSRIVPEFAPLEDAETDALTLHAVGDADQAWLVRSSAQGVLALPLQAASANASDESLHQTASFTAEPAVVASAAAVLARQPVLQQAAQRWVMSTQTAWDLAQFDFANSGRQRSAKKLGDAWRKLLHAPQWRAARWGVLGLVLIQVLGLNAWAWKEKTELTAQRAEIRALLTQTFPQVKLIVDAPIQMARELSQLRQSAGASSGQDLEPLLSAMGLALPGNQAAGSSGLRSVDFAEGELRVKGMPDETMSAVRARLEAQGYAVRAEGDAVVIKAQGQGRQP
jgi:general secretion pathway protein L